MSRPDANDAVPRQDRYAVLLDIAEILTATLEAEDLYRTIYEQTSRVLETTGFYVSLYDARTDVATVVFYADRDERSYTRVSYRGSENSAIREEQPVLERLRPAERMVVLLGEADDEMTRSSISAPLMREGAVIGVLSAQSYRTDAYDAEDLKLLAAVADLAAVALDNARYVEETERRRREAERLEEIGRAITSSLELDEVLSRVTGAVLDLSEADTATVALLRNDGDLEIAMASGESGLSVGSAVPLPAEFRERLVERRESIALANLKNHPLVPAELRHRISVQSLLAVPLVAEDRVIGMLSAGHHAPRPYRDEDARQLERLAYQAAVAVENARLHRKIRTLSLTDPLTGLPNRRHLEMVLRKDFAAARRGRTLAIALFDLDHFKRYNDTAGHPAGDEALRRFGRILTTETREMNVAARYGGDEFISILSDADREGALRHARRVQRAVDDDSVLGRIGVSAGVAAYSPSMSSFTDLISAADDDLYRRKADRD